jgi:hypothetical protein
MSNLSTEVSIPNGTKTNEEQTYKAFINHQPSASTAVQEDGKMEGEESGGEAMFEPSSSRGENGFE